MRMARFYWKKMQAAMTMAGTFLKVILVTFVASILHLMGNCSRPLAATVPFDCGKSEKDFGNENGRRTMDSWCALFLFHLMGKVCFRLDQTELLRSRTYHLKRQERVSLDKG